MSRCLKQHVLLLCVGGAIVLLLLLLFTRSASAQSAPVSPDHPWHTSAELKIEADAGKIPDLRFNIDSTRTYALVDLIDLAEAHNPATRVDWERARAQAGALGVTRSELFPTLASAAVSQTARQQAFFGERFYGQETQNFQLEMDLNYTLFDFGARAGRINEAKAQLLAANFAFNDTHRQVIYQVQQSYYRLLNSMGQEDAARSSLSNAQAVQQAAEERLAHGLATLPDVLEARSATAQAEYELQAIVGAEQDCPGRSRDGSGGVCHIRHPRSTVGSATHPRSDRRYDRSGYQPGTWATAGSDTTGGRNSVRRGRSQAGEGGILPRTEPHRHPIGSVALWLTVAVPLGAYYRSGRRIEFQSSMDCL